MMEYTANPKTLKEKTVNQIWDKLKELLTDDTFKIERILYDEKHFGNIIVILTSKENIKIRFMMDRKQYFTCDVDYSTSLDEWYILEDILQIIGADPLPKFKDFFGMMLYAFRVVVDNWKAIVRLFDESHFFETFKKLEHIRNERGKEYEKRHNNNN